MGDKFEFQFLGKKVEHDCNHCDYLTVDGKCKMFGSNKSRDEYLKSLDKNKPCEYFHWQTSFTQF